MALSLYNSLTKKKETFKPLEKGKVKMYVCGPTVYDYASIGNMWSYLTADILRRYLEYLGYEVRLIKNITDVGHFTDDEGADGLDSKGEDKMEKAARREKKTPLEIAEHYIKHYQQDERKLNILAPHFQPRPTREITEIIKIVTALVEKGLAYETEDGVYFAVGKFKDYGRLSGNSLEDIQAGARVEVNETKKHPADFALWKKRVGENRRHSLYWDSPWGDGFPGWHIECTAMAIKYLGDSIDIHTGGEDNIFPHHECEIAQSESFTGKIFVKYWIHTRHFYVEGKKMSKSLGNVYTVSPTEGGRYESLEEKGYEPLVFRTLKLGSHFRSKANFTWEGMDQARKNWEKINNFYAHLTCDEAKPADGKNGEPVKLEIAKFRQEFEAAMNDNLNTPEALAVVLKFVREGNRLLEQGRLANPRAVCRALLRMDEVLGIVDEERKNKLQAKIPAKVRELARQRNKLRIAKKFKEADELRKKIEKQGFEVLDRGEGFKIKRKS